METAPSRPLRLALAAGVVLPGLLTAGFADAALAGAAVSGGVGWAVWATRFWRL
jgi:hypothetical protein